MNIAAVSFHAPWKVVADRFEAGESGFKVEEIREFSGIERTGSLYLIQIEVKYQSKISNVDMKSILKFMDKFSVTKGIVVTRNNFNTEFFGEK